MKTNRIILRILAILGCFLAFSSIMQEKLMLENFGIADMLLIKGISTRDQEPVGEPEVIVSYDYELYYEIGRENYETYTYSRKEGTDLWWLAHLIRGEADTATEEDMWGVAIVAMNRVGSSLYPDTISEVVKEIRKMFIFFVKCDII